MGVRSPFASSGATAPDGSQEADINGGLLRSGIQS